MFEIKGKVNTAICVVIGISEIPGALYAALARWEAETILSRLTEQRMEPVTWSSIRAQEISESRWQSSISIWQLICYGQRRRKTISRHDLAFGRVMSPAGRRRCVMMMKYPFINTIATGQNINNSRIMDEIIVDTNTVQKCG